MMQTIANFVVHGSSLIVLACTLLSINEMTAATNHFIRIAYCVIATAAVACIAGDLTDAWQIGLPCALAMVGMAVLLVADRRRRWSTALRRDDTRHVTH